MSSFSSFVVVVVGRGGLGQDVELVRKVVHSLKRIDKEKHHRSVYCPRAIKNAKRREKQSAHARRDYASRQRVQLKFPPIKALTVSLKLLTKSLCNSLSKRLFSSSESSSVNKGTILGDDDDVRAADGLMMLCSLSALL